MTITLSNTAQAFCGFYVAKADTSLFNRASQVVLVRDGDRTVITMANDFEGDVKDFAVVVPVPTFIERGQINVSMSVTRPSLIISTPIHRLVSSSTSTLIPACNSSAAN
jgi:hypothetical protein